MTNTSDILKFAALAALLFLTAFCFVLFQGSREAYGSVNDTAEYTATTTASNANAYGTTIIGSTVVATSSITLGSVVITGANTAVWNIYDATTTDVTKRKLATSSLLIATFPASIVAGTYTFDVRLKDGLLIDVQSGTMPTTTITTRR